jgi:hypothetical protein
VPQLTHDVLRVRPTRFRVLLAATIALSLSAYSLYTAASADAVSFTSTVLATAGSAIFIANYLLFHYVRLDAECIQKVEFFCLIRKTIALADIRQVEGGSVRPTLFRYATIVFRSPDSSIDFIPELYERRAVLELIRRLVDLGIPVEDALTANS